MMTRAAWVSLAIALGGLNGCGTRNDTQTAPPDEPTPEQMAEQLGVPNEPGARSLKPRDFPRYSLVVDVFRRSSALPVLGAFEPRYVDLLTSPGSGTPDQRLARAKEEFQFIGSSEFIVVSVDGKVLKTNIASAAIEGYAEGGYRTTPPGAYKLDILRYSKKIIGPDGKPKTELIDFPWIKSETFGNSIMYWGLWIFGGYFIHSTPHYSHLGSPASMGCVRQPYPDAMELFRLRQTHLGMIRIHPIGSQQAYDRLREITSPEWAIVGLAESHRNILAYMDYANSGEISVQGHSWIDPATDKPRPISWPECGPVDCFAIWGRKKPASF